jgi:hypothetical protein
VQVSLVLDPMLATGGTAVETVKNTIASRSNCFVLMKDLNKWDDISSQSRYVRTQQLLRNHFGKIDRQKMIEFSMTMRMVPAPTRSAATGSDPHAWRLRRRVLRPPNVLRHTLGWRGSFL